MGLRTMIRNMKEFDQMDDDEQDTVAVGCFAGIAVGMAQWLPLRKRVSSSSVLLVVAATGWALGGRLFRNSFIYWPRFRDAHGDMVLSGLVAWMWHGALIGGLAGAMSGTALAWLLARPPSEQ